jgi:hypothetical protein
MAQAVRHRKTASPASGSTLHLAAVAPGHGEHDAAVASSSSAPARRTDLMSLPTELHLAIAQHLIYPDALSLKHTSRHFYSLVFTGVKLKVEWLVERRSLHLECPNDRRCDLGSDLRFCRGSVPLLMKRRREHMECESRPGLGCLVYGTQKCTSRKKRALHQWQRRLHTTFTVKLWWLLLAGATLLFGLWWKPVSPGILAPVSHPSAGIVG